MKKELLIRTSVLKKYFLSLLLLMGLTGYINAQNIDFNAGCPNAPANLAEQEVGNSY
jgi:hypothetical protein